MDGLVKMKSAGLGTYRFPSEPRDLSNHAFGFGGSPVLAWRRHRRSSARSVLPPLEHPSREVKDLPKLQQSEHIWTGVPVFTTSLGSSVSQKKLRQSSCSLPPGCDLRCTAPSGTLKPLRGSSGQGPPLRQTLHPSAKDQGCPMLASMEAFKLDLLVPRHEVVDAKTSANQVSAMALDLMPDTEVHEEQGPTSGNDKDSAENTAEIVEEVLLPAPEDLGEQHWFPTEVLEAQVKSWRAQEPIDKNSSATKLQDASLRHYLRALEVQECSADGDDDHDEMMFVSYMPVRVRPGEFLVWDPKEEAGLEADMDITEEDIADFTAGNAVDAGLRHFMTEVLLDDEFGDEEEV